MDPPVIHTEEFDPASILPNTCPFLDISFREVDKHLWKTSNTSTPGLSRISYQALKWAWSLELDLILYVLRWSLRLGIHHDDWKKAIMVVIPKPNKPSYSVPKAYQPIQLLECLGKLLEKIVAKRLMFDCSHFDLIPAEQFGGVSGASCVDTGLSIVHDIKGAINRTLTASLLTIDVKGFFDNINHHRLAYTLHKMGFPEPIVRWTQSFLSNRSAACLIGNFLNQMLPVNVGVPQGSPTSPILSVIYSAPVLQFLAQDPFFTNKTLPIVPHSYIDDFSFLAISHSANHNVIALGNTLIRATDLLSDIGMRIDPEKSDLIHFSRARACPQPSIDVSLYGHNLVISPKLTVRWLGIFFDQKLTFQEHVKIMANRVTSVANGIRLLANTVRGLSQRHIRILFKTYVLPILTYASHIWFHTDCSQKSLVSRLERVQNISLRQICRGFKTMPIPAIQALSHQPPIELTLRKLSESMAIRLLKLPFRSLVSQRLPDVWRKGRKGDAPFRTLRRLPHNPKTSRFLSPIEHLSSLSDPKGERIFPFAKLNSPEESPISDHPRLHLQIEAVDEDERDSLTERINSLTTAFNRERHIFFCDGSYNDEDGAGSGVIHYCQGDITYKKDFNGFTSIGAGPKATAYDAEMLALTIAGSHSFDITYEAASNPDYPLSEICIYSDSTSALQNITDPSPHPGQLFSLLFIDHIKLALLACLGLQVYLCWSPGH